MQTTVGDGAMRRSAFALTAVLAIAGCKTAPEARPFVAPEIVRVPVKTYVALPEELTGDCPISRAESRKIGNLVDAYNRNIVSLQQCNAEKRAIRESQP